MKSLTVDDDFFSRHVFQTILANFGESHVAINGKEAISAFKQALTEGEPYKVVCLDAAMPEVDAQETLNTIRKLEEDKKIFGKDRVKIIMTTSIDNTEKIKNAFRESCEAYLTKPIMKKQLMNILGEFELVKKGN